MPLRVHAFGSLLQLLGSVSVFMAKNGVTQVDGMGKWDLVSLGRVVAVLFDEERLFGSQKEFIGDDDLFVKPADEKKAKPKKNLSKVSREKFGPAAGDKGSEVDVSEEKPQRRRRHQRNSFSFSNHSVDALDKTSNFGDWLSGISVENSDDDFRKRSQTIASLPSVKQTSTSIAEDSSLTPCLNKGSSNGSGSLGIDTSPAPDFDLSKLYPPTSSNPTVKVDSVSDFRSNLEIGLQNEESGDSFDKPLTASNVNSLMQKFGGLSGTGKKRWMTAPAPALATIREGEDDDSESGIPLEDDLSILPNPSSASGSDEPKEDIDNEIVLQMNKGAPSKKMRIPKVKGKAAPKKDSDPMPDITSTRVSSGSNDAFSPNPLGSALDSIPESPKPSAAPVSLSVPTSDELEKVGDDFLASIGSSFGMG
jgi:hypothetical protein